MKPNEDKIDICLRAAWWLLLGVAIGVCIFVRIRLLQFPLERDEGEYAYGGQLMLQGIAPYKLAYSMKFPGTAAAYAVIMSIFGESVVGIHLGLLIVNMATCAVLFLIGRRLTNSIRGLAAAASYAVLSASASVLGFSAHAAHLLMLTVMAGVWLLLVALDRQSGVELCLSGLLLGLGMLMKQPAAIFILFGATYFSVASWRMSVPAKLIVMRTLMFCIVAAVPLAVTCLIVWRAGVFGNFWFWTWSYAREYATLSPASNAAAYLRVIPIQIIGAHWLLWLLGGIGLLITWRRDSLGPAIFLTTFSFFSAIALCIGFYFRPHYFFFILPALSLLVGLFVTGLPRLVRQQESLTKIVVIIVFCAAITWPIFRERDFLFSLSPLAVSRSIYGECPFPESPRIGEFIRNHSQPADKIAVLGSEPEIYFYAGRHSATGYLYTYSLMEPQKYAHRMQLEMIHEIEAARPKFFVSVVINDSWWPRPDSERLIFNWADQYLAENYSAVGLVNIVDSDRTDYYFDRVPTSLTSLKDYVLIYERK